MARIPKLVSVWALLAFILLVALQVSPVTGIFLMILGAPFVAGLLVHVFLLSLLVEAFTDRVPRLLTIVPLAAYAGYYTLYGLQWVEMAQRSAEMRASNLGKVLDFDPKSYSLVTTNASLLVQQYEIPVAYETAANFVPERHLSFRLIRRDQCDIRKDSQSRIEIFGVHFGGAFQRQLCELRFPETPPYKIVTVARRGDDEMWNQKWDISEQITELSVDGAVIGSFRTASVRRLPVLPFGGIGCTLISSTPAWKCFAEFMRSHASIDGVPDRVDRVRYDSPESVMLGIRKYTAADLADFRGFEQNDAALVRVAGEPQRVEDDAFDVLQAVVDGRNPKPPFNMGHSIGQNPERLRPFAEAMVRRFVELNDPTARGVPNREGQVPALEAGIAALPRDAFPKVADPIFEIVRQERGWAKFPVLYMRAADAGSKTFAFYKNDFMLDTIKGDLRMLPVLAICRIGQADEVTIAEMKQRFVASEAAGDGYRYKSALAVALLTLGQGAFLKEHAPGMRLQSRGWLDAVLAQKGATETGPNNCMALEWPLTGYLGPVMTPTLKWLRGEWTT